ncbi:MAG: YdcH family protein [Phenylobacterium sp.]|nr:YdcH family protein [Phenylobacterium sp.]
MPISHRLYRLYEQQRWIDSMLRDEQRRMEPDDLRLRDLKRRKSQVKDEIRMAEAGLIPIRNT